MQIVFVKASYDLPYGQFVWGKTDHATKTVYRKFFISLPIYIFNDGKKPYFPGNVVGDDKFLPFRYVLLG